MQIFTICHGEMQSLIYTFLMDAILFDVHSCTVDFSLHNIKTTNFIESMVSFKELPLLALVYP